MRRPNLNTVAAQQAHAEYAPQRRGVRRDIRGQVRSIRSSAPALEASLGRTADQLRHINLSAQDRAIALRELAMRQADVGASTALQEQQVRQQGHEQLVDLAAAEGQARSSALAQMQQAATERHQDLADERRAEVRQFKMDILKEQALKELGLGSYADDGGRGGLTPTQRRAAHEEHDNAAFYAKQIFQASKHGLTDEKTGEVLVPPDPQKWDDSIWNQLVESVAGKEGVDSVEAAQRAVSAIRDHVQPGANATAPDLLRTLGMVASAAAPAVAPKPLVPIAQFGSALLRPRR